MTTGVGMRGHLLSSLALTGGGLAFASVALVEAGGVLLVWASQGGGLSPDTPIGGLTVGVLLVIIVAAGGFLWKGSLMLVRLGVYLQEIRNDLNEGVEASKRYARLESRVSTVESAVLHLLAESDDTGGGDTADFLREAVETRLGLRKTPPGLESEEVDHGRTA